MKEDKRIWKRPEDIETIHTSDPKVMLGKYLPKRVLKTWIEDFSDEDTGEVVSIERNQVLMERGKLTNERVSEVMFFIQSGDIDGVDVCEDNVADMTVYVPNYLHKFNVEIQWDLDKKEHYICYAQTIPQAIKIATEFGQMYRGISGWVGVPRVVTVDAQIVPDNHQCIPENDRKPAEERKDYFKVQVRHEWFDGDKLKKGDTNYIIHAEEVGEAKERIARLLDIIRADREKQGDPIDPNDRITIRKAAPFEVDCIVPREFSEMYHEEPTK
jgi:hypothetical protein